MITQEFLSQCSDEQINKGVVWAKVSELNLTDYNKRSSTAMFKWYGPPSEHRSYCTNPDDIMPIAFANELFVIPCIDGGYMASDGVYDTEIEEIIGECNWAHNKNPLRAICEVYILMSVNK